MSQLLEMIYPRCVIKPVYIIQYTVIHNLRVQSSRRLFSTWYKAWWRFI